MVELQIKVRGIMNAKAIVHTYRNASLATLPQPLLNRHPQTHRAQAILINRHRHHKRQLATPAIHRAAGENSLATGALFAFGCGGNFHG
jgi:hypothetical protein